MTARIYRHYQKIFVVSVAAKQIFDNVFPQFKNKTEVRYNIVPKEQIRQLADEGNTFPDDFHGKRILTVGRISKEKGQRMALGALKILINKGYDVRWYFVGDGFDLEFYRQFAVESGLADYSIFLGLQTNPYGYMRDCDIYVQPSLHEGFCITLAEALCFNHPIVCTQFTGAVEQLKDRNSSIVVDISPEALAEGVEKFLI
jgi:glycosyltransferase involved in cell wall biosynthesis